MEPAAYRGGGHRRLGYIFVLPIITVLSSLVSSATFFVLLAATAGTGIISSDLSVCTYKRLPSVFPDHPNAVRITMRILFIVKSSFI